MLNFHKQSAICNFVRVHLPPIFSEANADGHRDGGRTELKIERTLDSNQKQVSMSRLVFITS